MVPRDHGGEDPAWMHDLTLPQRSFFRMLTDQRVANLISASDLIGDMDGDVYQILEMMGTNEYRDLRQFMWRCNPEVLKFLYEMRKEELEELKAAIETYMAFKRTGRVIKIGAASLFAAFVGMSLLWDKIASWIKPPPLK